MKWSILFIPSIFAYYINTDSTFAQPFPVRACGSWSMIACTNPTYIGAELFVDYNAIQFTPVKKYGFIHVKKNMYGSIFLKEYNKSKIVWLPSVKYDIETAMISLITLPVKHKCSKITVTYSIDPSYNWITVYDKNEQYVFRRNIVVISKSDSILKIFLTQLLLDIIIRNVF